MMCLAIKHLYIGGVQVQTLRLLCQEWVVHSGASLRGPGENEVEMKDDFTVDRTFEARLGDSLELIRGIVMTEYPLDDETERRLRKEWSKAE